MRRYGAVLLLVGAVVLIYMVPTASTVPTSTIGLTIPPLTEAATLSTTPVFATGQWAEAPDWTRTGPLQGGMELNPRTVISIGGGAFVWGYLPGEKSTDFKRIDLASGVVSEVSEPPPGDCAHVLTAGSRLLAWSVCEPGPIYQFDGDQSWPLIADGGSATLDANVVWTGFDLWFWRRGLRISIPSGSITDVEPVPLEGPVVVAFKGRNLMVMPADGKPPVISTGGEWGEIEDAPIGSSGRILAASLGGIVVVNDRWEAAFWARDAWTRIESVPLSLGDQNPEFITSTGLTIVRGTIGGAQLVGTEWQPLIDPYIGSGIGRPDGPWVAVGNRLFQIEATLISRSLPTGGSGMVESQAIPLQAMALAIPKGWSASLITGGSESRFAYTLSDGSNSCQVAAIRGEGGRSLEEKVVVQSAWNGLPMTVRVDTFPEGWIAAVDYATETSDLVQISCAARDLALRLAAQVYSPPELG